MGGAVAENYATSTTDAGLPLQQDFGPDIWALTSEGNPNLYLLNNFAAVSLNDQVCSGTEGWRADTKKTRVQKHPRASLCGTVPT